MSCCLLTAYEIIYTLVNKQLKHFSLPITHTLWLGFHHKIVKVFLERKIPVEINKCLSSLCLLSGACFTQGLIRGADMRPIDPKSLKIY